MKLDVWLQLCSPDGWSGCTIFAGYGCYIYFNNACQDCGLFISCAAPNHPLRAYALTAAGSSGEVELNAGKYGQLRARAKRYWQIPSLRQWQRVVKYIYILKRRGEWRTVLVRLTYPRQQGHTVRGGFLLLPDWRGDIFFIFFF